MNNNGNAFGRRVNNRGNKRHNRPQQNRFQGNPLHNIHPPRFNKHSNNHTNNRNTHTNIRNTHTSSSLFQYLPLIIYLFAMFMSFLSLYTNRHGWYSRTLEKEWKRNKLAVVLFFLIKILWATVLYMLCANHYTKTAWFLFFLPALVVLALFFFLYEMIRG